MMQKRKAWSQEEDRILKFLREQRGEGKWSSIARMMQGEFGLGGRSSKQCRERYHNHLDSSIVTDCWRAEEDETLLQLHQELGNKWSAIAQHLPGRTDNCVKNHFYSKLRKNLRKLNRVIAHHADKDTPAQLKEKILSKIIEIQETRFDTSSRVDEEMAEFCNGIKNRLFELQLEDGEEGYEAEEGLYEARRLIVDIEIFEGNYKKGYKAIKRSEFDLDLSNFLRPPPHTSVRRRNSAESSRSDDSILSSSSCISSCSDLSEYDQNEERRSTRSCKERKESHEEDVGMQKIERDEQGQQEAMRAEQFVMGMREQFVVGGGGSFERQHQMEEESHKMNEFEKQLFNISYENTPMTARVLAPAGNIDTIEYPLFPHPSENDDFIEFKEEEEV